MLAHMQRTTLQPQPLRRLDREPNRWNADPMAGMKTLKTYASRVEADLDRIVLEQADVPCVVVGIGVAMEGGIQGVRLLVPEDQAQRAIEVLDADSPS